VNGSNIVPNLVTKLYFLATTPSKESLNPITVITEIRETGLNSSGLKKINKNNEVKNLKSVIKFGKTKISLKLKEDL